jgi:hypothetical protein
MNESSVQEIVRLLDHCSKEQRHEIFRILRAEFGIHPIEARLNVQAEVILAAIDRSNDLIQRGIRGVIAEAAFESYALESLAGWTRQAVVGDQSYDFLISDSARQVRIQVKMQRLKGGNPMMANQGYRILPPDMYVVETQRTRGGTDKAGKKTRPYRFGEFDILAVSMHPSTHEWDRFMYTVANWLLPDPHDADSILKFQPIAVVANDVRRRAGWTGSRCFSRRKGTSWWTWAATS